MTHRDAAPQRTLAQGALAWAAACCLAIAPIALATGGARAAAAMIVGAVTMGLAVGSIARLLEGLLQARPGGARLRALAAAAMRWPLLAGSLAASLWMGLPAGWLLVGVTAWPAALLIEGLRTGRAAPVMPRA